MTNVTVESADNCTVNTSRPAETDAEHRLLADLMKYYNLEARPVLNKSERVLVTFGLALTQIVELVSGEDSFATFVLPNEQRTNLVATNLLTSCNRLTTRSGYPGAFAWLATAC